MRSAEEFEKLVLTTLDRIDAFGQRYGVNHIYAAYSGGKDSQAVASLSQRVYPHILLVHNEHPGEVCDRTDVLIVRGPKKENVPAFLKTVDLVGQIDGTRQDEDKTVIFDGKEIHRSNMPHYETEHGVFDLACLFPLWDWTEEDVLRYLNGRRYDPIKVRDVRVGYEGEGPLLGTKTLYCRYPGNLPINGKAVAEPDSLTYGAVNAIYVTADYITEALMYFVGTGLGLKMEATIEVPLEQMDWGYIAGGWERLRWFVRCTKYQKIEKKGIPQLFIKIEIDPSSDWAPEIALATEYAKDGHDVLLMPLVGNRDPKAIGQQMMAVISHIHPKVRLMPPVHKLLGIP